MVSFLASKPVKTLVKVATSFTSIANARKNLACEIPGISKLSIYDLMN